MELSPPSTRKLLFETNRHCYRSPQPIKLRKTSNCVEPSSSWSIHHTTAAPKALGALKKRGPEWVTHRGCLFVLFFFKMWLQESWSSIYLAHTIFPWLLLTKGQGCFALFLRKGLTLKPRVTLSNQQPPWPSLPCAEHTGGQIWVPALGEQNFTWMMLCFSFPEGWAPLLDELPWNCVFLVHSVGFPTEDSHFPAHQRLYQGCVHLHPNLLLTSLSWFLFLQVPSFPGHLSAFTEF